MGSNHTPLVNAIGRTARRIAATDPTSSSGLSTKRRRVSRPVDPDELIDQTNSDTYLAEIDNETDREVYKRAHQSEVSSRHDSTMDSPAPLRNGPVRRTALSTGARLVMTNQELAQHYEHCVDSMQTSRITKENAFEMLIIDYLSDVICKDGTVTDFSKAGTTVDVGAKIYAFRVDKVHQETREISAQIASDKNKKKSSDNQVGEGDEDDVGMGDDDEDTEEDRTAAKKAKAAARRQLQKQRHMGRTIESNSKLLDQTGVDAEEEIDPLFIRCCRNLDEEGTQGYLAYSLHSSVHQASEACRSRLHCFDDFMATASTSATSRSLNAAMDVDITVDNIQSLLGSVSVADVSLVLCPSVEHFEVNKDINTTTTLFGNDTTGLVLDDVAGNDVSEFDDDSPPDDAFNDVLEQPSHMHPIRDYEAAASADDIIVPPWDEEGSSEDVADQNEAIEMRFPNIEAIEAAMGKSGSEYWRADQDMVRKYANAMRWKNNALFARPLNLLKTNKAATAAAKKRVKRVVAALDFDSVDFVVNVRSDVLGARDQRMTLAGISNTDIDFDGLPALVKSRKQTTLVRQTLEKWGECDKKTTNIDADCMDFDMDNLLSVFSRPLKIKQSPSDGDVEADGLTADISGDPLRTQTDLEAQAQFAVGSEEAHDAAIGNDEGTNENYDEGWGAEGYEDDDDADAAGNLDLDEPGTPVVDDLVNATLEMVAEPQKVSKIDIAFAKRAKKLDIRRMKKIMWQTISTPQSDNDAGVSMSSPSVERIVTGQHKFSDACRALMANLPKSMAEDVTPASAFVCFLHIVNEKSVLKQDLSALANLRINNRPLPSYRRWKDGWLEIAVDSAQDRAWWSQFVDETVLRARGGQA